MASYGGVVLWEEVWPCGRSVALLEEAWSCGRKCGLVEGAVSLRMCFNVSKVRVIPRISLSLTAESQDVGS